MMVAVQLDKKEVFDRIWRWSKNIRNTKAGLAKDILPGVSIQKR